MHIHLYGRNRGKKNAYRTKFKKWIAKREKVTGIRVVNPNVDSKGKARIYREMSPMLMGPVDCYREDGKLVQAVNVEVAWQYSKVYSHKKVDGKFVDISDIYIEKDSSGKIIGPSKVWFAMRDKAFTNETFRSGHPGFKKNKTKIRRAFPKHSIVCFWYWDGKMMNRDQARQKIYATIYKRFLVKTEGYRWLKAAYNRSQDIAIYDEDGYDWKTLGKTPEQCITDDHSFGHGHVIAMMLQGIDPTKLVKSAGKFVPTIQAVQKNGRLPKLKANGSSNPPAPLNGASKNGTLKLDWRKYDSYKGKQVLMKADGKAAFERLAVDILQIPATDAEKQWGEVYSPGRYAAVVHVFPGIRHGFSGKGKEIGFKVFNQNPKDGLKWGPRLIKFHAEQRDKMPGLPHPRVQEVITTGSQITPDGRTHRYIIQKWIAGDTLDMLIKRGITQSEILRVLDDLFLKVVIPLWRVGVVWWDFRLNNMVFTPERELHMIDSDVLEASAKELLTKPNEFRKRNRHSRTLINRYREWMLQPMLLKYLCVKGEPAKEVCAKLEKLFATRLHPAFLEPFPRDAKTKWDGKAWAKRATAAYQSFHAELVELFRQYGGTQPAKNGKHQNSPSPRH